jgi:hypothetical protein
LPLTEVSPQPSAIPGGNPPGDWQSAVGWGDTGIEPRTADNSLVRYHWATTPPSWATTPPSMTLCVRKDIGPRKSHSRTISDGPIYVQYDSLALGAHATVSLYWAVRCPLSLLSLSFILLSIVSLQEIIKNTFSLCQNLISLSIQERAESPPPKKKKTLQDQYFMDVYPCIQSGAVCPHPHPPSQGLM